MQWFAVTSSPTLHLPISNNSNPIFPWCPFPANPPFPCNSTMLTSGLLSLPELATVVIWGQILLYIVEVVLFHDWISAVVWRFLYCIKGKAFENFHFCNREAGLRQDTLFLVSSNIMSFYKGNELCGPSYVCNYMGKNWFSSSWAEHSKVSSGCKMSNYDHYT